jgi:hypothetical protein
MRRVEPPSNLVKELMRCPETVSGLSGSTTCKQSERGLIYGSSKQQTKGYRHSFIAGKIILGKIRVLVAVY